LLQKCEKEKVIAIEKEVVKKKKQTFVRNFLSGQRINDLLIDLRVDKMQRNEKLTLEKNKAIF